MTATRFSLGVILLVQVSLAWFSKATAYADEPACFKAQLIWGTNREKVDDPELKKVDAKLVERFKRVFKWEHYYRVNEEHFCVPARKAKKVKLSEQCHLQVRDKGKPMVEVKLYGKGKLINKITQAAIKCLVIAGDDKNDTAWFVVLFPE